MKQFTFGIAMAALIAVAASLQAEEDRIEPVLRDVVASSQLSVTYVPGTGFHAKGDAKEGVASASKTLAVLPKVVDGKLTGFGVVSFEPTAKKVVATWPALTTVKDAKTQHIATVLNVTIAPVFVKGVLTGFEIATIASRKGTDSAGEISPASKTEKAAAIRKVALSMPKHVTAGQWYGVKLVPVMDAETKKLNGFDIMLVSTPVKKAD